MNNIYQEDFKDTEVLCPRSLPVSIHKKNIRTFNETKKYWKAISKYIRKDGICYYCHRQLNQVDLAAHEVWGFDSTKSTVFLKDIIPVCTNCHNVIHFGRAQILGTEKDALDWLKKINQINDTECNNILERAHRNFIIRSRKKWSFDKIQICEKIKELTGIYIDKAKKKPIN